MKQKTIGIIGGGYTGLTAAYRLSNLGYKVTIFEKNPNLGGLVGGFKMAGFPLERAYHFLYKTDKDIQNLAEELGIRETLKFYPSSMSTYYDKKLYPLMTPMDLIKFKPLSFVNRIRAGLTVLYLQYLKNWHPLKKITAYDWLYKYAGKQVTEVLWLPLLKGKFDKYFDKIVMSWLWGRVKVRVISKDPGDATEKLGYFDGGFNTFTQALVKKLEENRVEIQLNADIKEIHKNDDGSSSIMVGNKEEKFDRVLATIPSHVFGKLVENNKGIDQKYLELLNSIPYLGAVLMVFSSKKAITPYYWHNINELNSPFVVFLSLTALVGSEKFDGNHIYYIGDYVPHEHKYFQMSDDEIANLWKSKLGEIFPKFDMNQLENINVFKFKNAQHIVGLDYESRIPPYESPLKGIYMANFTQIYPDDRGTNFAVQEGNKIAKLIDESF
jgi:protoporphyrinogen oxidase